MKKLCYMTGVNVDVAAEAVVKQSKVKVSALEAHVTGIETGATATAEYNDTRLSAKAGNVNVTGIKAKATAEAKLNTGRTVDVGNVEAMGIEPVGAQVNVDARKGLATGNVKCGVTGKSGISLSTKTSAFNVNATVGLPRLSVGLGFNLAVPFVSGASRGSENTSTASNSNNENSTRGEGITVGSNDANAQSGRESIVSRGRK